VLVEKAQRQPLKKSELESTIEASLGHHICRCTGYVRYYDATREVLTDLGLVKEG
jgi:aerobic-type carbon monoxide dehydrogenase small subunit (CoxS/CutS family)